MGSGCGTGAKPAAEGDGQKPPAKKIPATLMTDSELVNNVADSKLQSASVTMGRSAAARKRRLLKEEFMKRFDATGQGTLTREEVKALMTKYEGDDFVPTDEQVDLVMRVGGETCKPVLTTDELVLAMAIVKAMADQEKELTETFERYDVNNSGQLESNQLANLLKDLNKGKEVPQEEVDIVLKQADAGGTNAISREELKPAIMIWYTMQEERDDAPEEADEHQKEQVAAATVVGLVAEQIAEVVQETAAEAAEAAAE